MRSFWFRWLFFLPFCITPVCAQQTQQAATPASPPQRDPQALTVMAQSLNTAGGVPPLSAIQDFKGLGTITYYWAGKEVQGSVTVQGRGTGQFRLDASLPEGMRSIVVSNGSGTVKEANGTTTAILSHNSLNLGSLTFPFTYLVSALADPSTSITYAGLETTDAGPLHHIRLQKTFAFDPGGIRSKLTTRDFFIDPGTLLVLRTRDMLHPKDSMATDIPHELQFSDYRPVNGISVPFTITEFGGDQRLNMIQLSQISFNKGLQDGDFQP
jgi:outer membrane lipoprotein-sorting protein